MKGGFRLRLSHTFFILVLCTCFKGWLLREVVVHTSQGVACVTNGHVSNVLEPSVIEHPLEHPDVLSSGWKERTREDGHFYLIKGNSFVCREGSRDGTKETRTRYCFTLRTII